MTRTFPIVNMDGIVDNPTREQQIAVINTLIHYDALGQEPGDDLGDPHEIACMLLAPMKPAVERRSYRKDTG
jgi:hypothetical protein